MSDRPLDATFRRQHDKDLLPRPTNTTDIRCPSCGHMIDNHDRDFCLALGCMCGWSPNDIAWAHIYGGLTRG